MTPLPALLTRRHTLALLGATSFGISLATAADAFPEILVHRDTSCGCCGAWVEHVRRAGFRVKIVETGDLNAVKQRLGVPANLVSCHTAEVQGYVIEGHVPVAAIQSLLRDKPKAAGLAVPGMPVGSPGMEGGAPETYEVVLFGSLGQKTFARYRGSQEI